MKNRLVCWFSVVLVTMLAVSSPVRAAGPLLLSVHPYKSPVELVNAFKPLADYLSEKTGMPVEITIAKDYAAHLDSIGRDQIDIAYMGPASYVSLIDRYGKKPLLACQEIHGKPTFQGKIIIRKESNISTLQQLKDKSFAFGDPGSTMSHLVPRYMLMKAGVNFEKPGSYKFLGSHDNVALSVLAGDYDAGAVKEGVFYKYEQRGLKALATTPALTEHNFVASAKLDAALVKKLREAFLVLSNDPRGQQIMTSIKPGITAMTTVEDKDYDNLREILRTLKDSGVIK